MMWLAGRSDGSVGLIARNVCVCVGLHADLHGRRGEAERDDTNVLVHWYASDWAGAVSRCVDDVRDWMLCVRVVVVVRTAASLVDRAPCRWSQHGCW